MLRALVHLPSPHLENCELTYLESEAIDLEKAVAQHRGYRDLLDHCGAEVTALDGNLELPDSVFVEDTALVLEEIAVMTPMGVESRRGESELIAAELARHRTVERIESPAKLEGGDVLRVDRQLFVGLGTRTDLAGLEALRSLVEPFGYEVTGVDVPGCLHLKTGCTALDAETVLINPQWVDPRPFGAFRRLEVAPDEPFAANTLPVGEKTCMPTEFAKTRGLVEAAGYDVEVTPISEFLKAEAGLTCMSLIFSE